MSRKGAFMGGVLAGIAAPATLGATVRFKRLEGTDLSRMRGYVVRVGKDFATVTDRENDKLKESRQNATAATSI